MIGCILLITSTTVIGFYLSLLLQRRMMLFDNLVLFITNVSTSIRYNSNDIYSILLKEYPYTKIPFLDTVLVKLEQGNSVDKSWCNGVDALPFSHGLRKKDKAVIKQFGSKLGTTDVDGQISHCEYFKNLYLSLAQQFKDEYTKCSKVYRSLGFFSGLAFSLVIY